MIKICKFLDQDFIRSAIRLTSSRPLFPAVREVALCVNAQAFALLAPSMVTVKCLKLWVDDPNNEICGLVSQLPCLTHLVLKFLNIKEFSRNELTSLAKLRNLCDLRLEYSADMGENHPDLGVPWMTDSDFKDWICSFPHLKVLRLGWNNTRLTAGATASLAHQCPNLVSVAVQWHHNLDMWMASPPPFKNLEIINFRSMSLGQDSNNLEELLVQTEKFEQLLHEVARLGYICVLVESYSLGVLDYQLSIRRRVRDDYIIISLQAIMDPEMLPRW